MGWGDEKNLKLIELYRSHECLWNPRHKDYKNNIMRNNTYFDLINNVDCTLTVKTLKAKIKNLRTTYHCEVKKIEQSKRSGFGAEDVYYSSISWFYEMDSFLKDISKYRDTIESETNESSQDFQLTGNVNESSQDSQRIGNETNESSQGFQLTGNVNESSQDSQRIGNVKKSSQDSQSTDNDMPTTPNSDNLQSQSQSFISDTPTKRKRKISQEQPITLALERLENISSIINTPAEYDEFYFFGLNVAAQLRALPLYESLDIQTEIQSILAAARRRHLQVLPTTSAYSTNTNTPPINSTFRNPGTQTLTRTSPSLNTKLLRNPKTESLAPSTSTQITSTFRNPGSQTLTCTRPTSYTKPLTNPKTVTKIVTPSTSTQITSTFRNPGTQTLTCTRPTSITNTLTIPKTVTKNVTPSTGTQMVSNSEGEENSEEESDYGDLDKYTEYLEEDAEDE